MKRPDGVTVIAIGLFVISFFMLIGTAAIMLFAVAPVTFSHGSMMGRLWALFGLGLGMAFTSIPGLVGVLAGWGLLQLKEWARWVTIVLAILGLFAFPVGTIIGAAVIWYLLQPQVALAFGAGVPIVPTSSYASVPPVGPMTPPTPPSQPPAPEV